MRPDRNNQGFRSFNNQTPDRYVKRIPIQGGKAQSKFTMSFNSSDIAAYENESPIPVLKQAYLDYERNKRKAAMRRAITSKKAIEL